MKNRIVMSPMCMYASDSSGEVKRWHEVHYPTRAVGQAGLIFLEATAVTAQGRISASDLGIWSDAHVAGLRRLTDAIHELGSHIGIQLAHAGRKSVAGGPILAPSAVPFDETSQQPEAMTLEQIQDTVRAFTAAAQRAKDAGFDIIELHAAHGYLINEFLSPLSNRRTDAYGGDAAGRYRFLREIIDSVRTVWAGPLFVRVSAHEYDAAGNGPDDHVRFATWMKDQGVDLIDASSGGVISKTPETYPGYQVPFAAAIRAGSGVPTGAVGLITEPDQAEDILRREQADLIFLGRELLREPYWPRRAAAQLGVGLTPPQPYGRGW